MVSVIIPLYIIDEELEEQAYRCIHSIKEHADCELILIDNNGGEKFKDIADIYVFNKFNKGYGPSINQGFKLATGDYLCAMNDDVEVPTNWLDLLNALNNPLVGVVRPAENQEPGEGAKEDFTWYHGFCWIIKRQLWQLLKDKDGNLLDEQFRIANFEDLDLWKRILDRNYKLIKDFNVRVFHRGGLTIKKMKLDTNTLENEMKFIKKHSMPNWKEVFYP